MTPEQIRELALQLYAVIFDSDGVAELATWQRCLRACRGWTLEPVTAMLISGALTDYVYDAVNATDALVDGRARWGDLLEQTFPLGLTPPTLTDFLDLSVGGTLAVGGIGSQTFRWGPQIENVLALQAVTGRGTLVTCSSSARPDLFHAVRAGRGWKLAILMGNHEIFHAGCRTR